MSMDQRAHVLEATESAPHGVRDLIHILGWKSSKVIALLKEMNEERLIELKPPSISRRGRPKKAIARTPLGLEFLAAHRNLRMKPLRARRHDLGHAVKDALYSKRLVELGHSPFDLFMELNGIVDNIRVSSASPEGIRGQ